METDLYRKRERERAFKAKPFEHNFSSTYSNMTLQVAPRSLFEREREGEGDNTFRSFIRMDVHVKCIKIC